MHLYKSNSARCLAVWGQMLTDEWSKRMAMPDSARLTKKGDRHFGSEPERWWKREHVI